MEGLTRALAVELAPIRVNIVSPGVVRTPFGAA
jgi:NAD(P)-dependent dehydrogenase (short-subunit alcohol dehydrogenase family)